MAGCIAKVRAGGSGWRCASNNGDCLCDTLGQIRRVGAPTTSRATATGVGRANGGMRGVLTAPRALAVTTAEAHIGAGGAEEELEARRDPLVAMLLGDTGPVVAQWNSPAAATCPSTVVHHLGRATTPNPAMNSIAGGVRLHQRHTRSPSKSDSAGAIAGRHQ
jgi:hypothetical protein